MATIAATDALLSEMDLGVEALAVCDVRAGWTMDAPGSSTLALHYALEGRGRLHFSTGTTLDFGPGTLVFCPPGISQRITVVEGEVAGATRCRPAQSALPWMLAGEGSAPHGLLLACGTIETVSGPMQGLFDALAEPVSLDCVERPRAGQLFMDLLAELTEPGLGSKAMVSALMKQCLILVLRELQEAGDAHLPWLSALRDPGLAAAVVLMLRELSGRIGVDELAEAANCSRSTFIQRFQDAFGAPPRRFLFGLRMHKAAKLLRTTDQPVKTVAANVGYRSRSHFSKAFKNQFGVDPEGYRRLLHG